MSATQSPQTSPDYAEHRIDVAAADTIASVAKASGMNMSGYEHAHVVVVPRAGANPNVQVYWWCEPANAWIRDHTALAFAGVGVDTSYTFTVQCRGRRMFIAVTGGTLTGDDRVNVYVAGFRTVVQPVA